MSNGLEKVTTDQLIIVMGSYHYLYLFFKSVLIKTLITCLPILTMTCLRLAAMSYMFPLPIGPSTKWAQQTLSVVY